MPFTVHVWDLCKMNAKMKIITVKNIKYSNAEYWGKIPGIFKLFYRYSKMENVQNI